MMAGTGEVWPLLLRRFPGIVEITAIDISSEMHRQAMERLHRSRTNKIVHHEGDALQSGFPDASADFVISTFGMKTLNRAQHRRFAIETARILKPGGVFALIEASDPKGWTFRPLYRLYLDRVLPLIERVFLRGAQDFALIGVYTRSFGDCSALSEDLRAAGLEVTYHRYFFGCATGVAGRKPVP